MSTTVTRNSPWDEEQIADLVVATELRTELGSHGQPMHEALSPLADPRRQLPGGYHYEAHRRIDYAQQAVELLRKDLREKYKDADFSSDVYTVEKIWND